MTKQIDWLAKQPAVVARVSGWGWVCVVCVRERAHLWAFPSA